MSFQYDDSQIVSSQSTDNTHSLDGFARLPLDNVFLNAWPSTTSNYKSATPMLGARASSGWVNHAYAPLKFEDAHLANDCGCYYQCSASFTRYPQNDRSSQGHSFDGIPRNWQLTRDERTLQESTTFPPNTFNTSPYLREQSDDEAFNFPSLEPALLYEGPDRSRDFAQLSKIKSSTVGNDGLGHANIKFEHAGQARAHAGEASDDSGDSTREMTAMELDDFGANEPYAKLIYRALMSAPNHAMVLQQIYQWFRDNTKKGNSDTKGWMNSIRHNLSMNAAFRKSERKFSGDEGKKSTEWVLEDFAVRDGVQSTTRYRKGAGSKRAARSGNLTARRTSGRKGGFCAIKPKLQRQKIKEERTDRRSTPRVDISRQMQLHPSSRAVKQERQRSPLTPPKLESVSSPYFFPKSEPLDEPFEDIYGLEDVQGVYSDDHGALFSKGQQSPFSCKDRLSASPY